MLSDSENGNRQMAAYHVPRKGNGAAVNILWFILNSMFIKHVLGKPKQGRSKTVTSPSTLSTYSLKSTPVIRIVTIFEERIIQRQVLDFFFFFVVVVASSSSSMTMTMSCIFVCECDKVLVYGLVNCMLIIRRISISFHHVRPTHVYRC